MASLVPVGTLPALLLRKGSERVLVVGDLHIGWELTLAQQGVHVPSQTPKILSKLNEAVEASKPSRIIFLGDVKHTVRGAEPEEWRDIPEFFEAASKMVSDVQVVQGNHDGNLEPLTPPGVKILPASGIALWDRFGLLHGHAWLSPQLLGCETLIMGHLHPAVLLTDALGFRMTKPVWVKAPCDGRKLARSMMRALKMKVKGSPERLLKEKFDVKLKVSRCIFIPPFNDFLGGRPINLRDEGRGLRGGEEPLGPILRSGAVDLENAEVQMLDGTFLGRVRQLRALA